MSRDTYDVSGFTLVLDKVVMVSAVFEAENGEGWQFNIRMVSGMRVPAKRPTRAEAILERQLFIRALNGEKVTSPAASGERR